MRQVCIMSRWLFNVYMATLMNELKWGWGGGELNFTRREESGDYVYVYERVYADELVLCGDSEKDLRAIVGRFILACRRRGLKVNAGKSKAMLLGGEEGLECKVCINGYV